MDGQQRLTTLCLLHGRLTRKAGEGTFLHEPGRTRFRPQAMDAGTFDKLLQGEQPHAPQTEAQKRYVGAAREIDAWIGEDAARIARIRHLIEVHLHFILFVLRDETEVAKVFETINNRGKPLSQMDLVKNHLIYVAAVNGWTSPNVNEVWKNIQKIVGGTRFRDGDVDTVLRAVVTAQFRPGRRKAGETDFTVVSRELPADCDHKRFDLFLSFLESGFMTHRDMRGANDTDPKKPVTRALTHLNHHDGIIGVLPLIFARQFRRADKGETAGDAPVLRAIEIANFRLYGLPDQAARSDSHNVTLHKLAHAYFRRKKTDEDVIEDLRALVTREQRNGLPAIVRSLTLNDDDGTFDFHKWPWLRYFLGRFEEALLDRQSFKLDQLDNPYGGTGHTNDFLSVEHIWPQKHANAAVGADNEGQQIRRLGNLMLLPHRLNVQLSNHDVETKATKAAGSNVVRLRQNEEAMTAARRAKTFVEHLRAGMDTRFGEGESRFDESTFAENHDLVFVRTLCDLREQAMIAFALQAWRFPGEAGSGHVFEGMFSLAHSGEAYLASRDDPATKTTETYVIGLKEGDAPPAAERLATRREVTEEEFAPVSWD